MEFFTFVIEYGLYIALFFIFVALLNIPRFYNKVNQGRAIVRTGAGKAQVSFSGMFIVPVLHQKEIMDISVKRIEINRQGQDGLICKDNMRADIKVAFFVKVNKTQEDVLTVAGSIGCARASEVTALVDFFDAKFSEALKTVGKKYDFVELYNSRDTFKSDMLEVIGTDLNGYILEDAAIDYLEQTPMKYLSADNILDSAGIKKITELTAQQAILANEIARDKQKVIRQQDVEAREAILELDRQLAETEARQKREVESVQARETAETEKIRHEELLKSETARINAEEALQVKEENKQRQVIVAAKSKERTFAIETERVEKDRLLEVTERERVVELADIEKEKALEEERKIIQDVIRERVIVERAVVEEEEKIKDTREIAEAKRKQQVQLTDAETAAETIRINEVKKAEADHQAAKFHAEQVKVEAAAQREASTQQAEARKILAEATAKEEATVGLSEVQVMEARAHAVELEGNAEANVMERKANAEAMSIQVKADAEAHGIKAKAEAMQQEGTVEAEVMELKYNAEAGGIREKAEAMKALDGVGRDHEEFKLRLEKEKQIELAQINVQKDIAEAQANIIMEGLKSANIEIIGGDNMFFDQLVNAISSGKSVDRMVNNSAVLSDVKDAFFTPAGNGAEVANNIRNFVGQFGIGSEDIKNLTVAALLSKLSGLADTEDTKGMLGQMMNTVAALGLGDKPASMLNL